MSLRLGDDVADCLVGAVDGIEQTAAADQVVELGLKGGKFALPQLNVEQLGGEQVVHVTAGSASTAQVEDGGDFDQGEARGLAIANKREHGERRVVVLPVPVGASLRVRQQSLALVKADALSRDPVGIGDFSDAHCLNVPLDLVPGFKV